MVARLKSMPTTPLSVVIEHLRGDLGPDGDGMTDGELLARFVRSRDQDALAALVRRHAPMVWGVCRRLLNHHDAEDAFQAAFLVLVRKAADVPSHAVANWLYGVARQTAVRVRATAAKRGQRETQVANVPEPTVPEVRDADLQVAVDEELSRLPDHYRGVVVLCDLEGMTRKEAARQLGIPEGSVASRLARARAMLAKRLTRRGVVFSGSSAATLLSAGSAPSSAPPALVASTIQAASLLAAGQAAGAVTAQVAALTDGVVKAMFVTKIKSVLAVVLVVGLALACTAGLIYQTQAADKPNAKDTKAEKEQPVTKEEQPAKKEITGLAKEVAKMKIERLLNEKQEKSEAKTEIDDKEKIAQLLAFFPETGTGKRPDRSLPRPKKGDGASYLITLYPTKNDQEPIRYNESISYIMVSPDRQMWGWSKGGPPVNDDWNLNKPKEVGKLLDDLLAEKRQAQGEKEGNKNAETPTHIVEKPDMKGRVSSGLPSGATEDGAVVVKSFFAKMSTNPDIRFREFFDPRYLKKHGLTDRGIAFEIADHQGIDSLHVADDNLTVLVVLEVKGGAKEAFVMRCVVYEGHIYISPEAPDPKTGIFKPWILRTKVK